MSKRLELHDIFISLLGTQGQEVSRVYFQPPSTVKMHYPCIVYSRNSMNTKKADNRLYNHTSGYSVMVIAPDPDSEIPGKVLELPLCRFDRHYTSDNLNHDVFTLYY